MTDLAARLAQSLAGRYTIERLVGQGGMATVYLARDLRHNRNVALKVLRPDLGAMLGVERFLSEIQVTANLQHPNLLPLFDSGAAGDLLFYVMPFIDGETLRQRLEREKQLPVEEAVRIAVAVGGALEHAHRRGVIHRDLKPENILLQDGQPLVADFGIALAVSNAGGERVTQTGLSLGTPQYMSPEQATGDRVIDARADIYSLGAVTYEMLTGEPPHAGTTSQAIIARLLTEAPRRIRTTRPAVPEHVEESVLKALEKLPADRWERAREFTEALEGKRAVGGVGSARISPAIATVSAGQRTVRAMLVALPLVTALVFASLWLRARGSERPTGVTAPVNFTVELPANATRNGALKMLPDGRGLLYRTVLNGAARLVVRPLDQDSARTVAGTEGASNFAVSPSGTRIAFIKQGTGWIVPVTGGTPQSVPDLTSSRFAWLDEERLVTQSDSQPGLRIVDVLNGGSAELTQPDSSDARHRRHTVAALSADGEYVLFTTQATWLGEITGVGIVPARGGTFRLIDLPRVTPLGLVNGHLVYADDDGSVRAAVLDPATGTLGSSATLLRNGWGANLSIDGALVHSLGAPTGLVMEVDSTGRTSRVDTLDVVGILDPRLSPDGNKLLLQARRDRTWGVYVYDLERRTLGTRRVDVDGSTAGRWFPDGNRYLVTNRVADSVSHWVEYADRSHAPTAVSIGGRYDVLNEVLGDGQSMLLSSSEGVRVASLADGTRRDPPSGPIAGSHAAVSPDGRLIAYQTQEAGPPQVFIQPFDRPGARIQVSRQTGTAPQWTRDGRVVFSADSGFYIATIRTGPTLEADEPRPLLTLREPTASFTGFFNYAVRPDGRAIYVVREANDTQRVVVRLNWVGHAVPKTR